MRARLVRGCFGFGLSDQARRRIQCQSSGSQLICCFRPPFHHPSLLKGADYHLTTTDALTLRCIQTPFAHNRVDHRYCCLQHLPALEWV